MTFSFGGPAHAGDNAFSEWLCGGVDGCGSGGERSYRGLLGEMDLGFVTPAHAGDECGDWFASCASYPGSGGDAPKPRPEVGWKPWE
ncbi:MAG: hypothetical protein V6Z81_08280 [Parvularculales bacterium]